MSSGAAPGQPGGHREVHHRGLITVSIMLATVMQVLDTTIANVALPHMQGSLSAAQDTITWVLTSYIVASAIMTPVTGWRLRDRARKCGQRETAAYGRRCKNRLTSGYRRDSRQWRVSGPVPSLPRKCQW
jgi:hypothetical protein